MIIVLIAAFLVIAYVQGVFTPKSNVYDIGSDVEEISGEKENVYKLNKEDQWQVVGSALLKPTGDEEIYFATFSYPNIGEFVMGEQKGVDLEVYSKEDYDKNQPFDFYKTIRRINWISEEERDKIPENIKIGEEEMFYHIGSEPIKGMAQKGKEYYMYTYKAIAEK